MIKQQSVMLQSGLRFKTFDINMPVKLASPKLSCNLQRLDKYLIQSHLDKKVSTFPGTVLQKTNAIFTLAYSDYR